MKKVILIITLVFTVSAVAQTSNALTLEKQKMKLALNYGDENVAVNAMYNIISIEGEQSTYKDSLAYLYFNNRNYVSCFLVTEEILKRKTDNLELLEINAISIESIGAIEKAETAYQNLLSKTNNNYHAYKLANLQLGMKKFDKAYESILIADQLADDGTINVAYQINSNYNQNVPLKAGIAYLEGLILVNLEKETEAKVSFEKAIKLFPDFILGKEKLAKLNEVQE